MPGEAGAVPYPVAAGDVGAPADGQLMGWSIRENAGTPAAAAVRLRDGSGGQILASIGLAAGQSSAQTLQPLGVNFRTGIFVEIVAGSVEGSVFATL